MVTTVVPCSSLCIFHFFTLGSSQYQSPVCRVKHNNVAGSGSAEEFRFASIFSSQMVLQRAPHSPSVWGYGPPGSSVVLTLTGPSPQSTAHYEGLVGGEGVWSVSIGSWAAGESDSLICRMLRVGPRYGVQSPGQ